jgi:uncharacterized membrane protein YcaP (DUF421 family)
MIQEILFAFLRTVFAYLLVMFLVKILERKVISHMTLFDFVVGITLGATTANLALGSKRTIADAITVLMTLSLAAGITGYLHIKSLKIRKAVESEPLIVVANGKIVDKNLKKSRIALTELTMLLREKNVFNINDVEFALIEPDGRLSVLLKSQKQPVTPSDLNIATSYKGLTKDLILDGNIMRENLNDVKLDEEWLYSQLSLQNVRNVREVFYAGLDSMGNLYISVKNKTQEIHGKYGIE